MYITKHFFLLLSMMALLINCTTSHNSSSSKPIIIRDTIYIEKERQHQPPKLSEKEQKLLSDALRIDAMYKNQNKVYQQQAYDYAQIIAQPPAIIAVDSLVFGKNFEGTHNFNLRKPNIVIIHHTAQNSCEQTLYTFQLQRTQVSAHYVICRNGTVYQMLNDYLRAWHAGSGTWGSITDLNSASIGIELDNNGFEPFAEKQIDALIKLLLHLKKAYNIPTANFIGHADIAPGRKSDPSVHFPWEKLAQYGLGYWVKDNPLLVVPADFDIQQALKLIGYNIDNPTAAIIAFRRHFCGIDSTEKILSEKERRILFQLYTKYL